MIIYKLPLNSRTKIFQLSTVAGGLCNIHSCRRSQSQYLPLGPRILVALVQVLFLWPGRIVVIHNKIRVHDRDAYTTKTRVPNVQKKMQLYALLY